MKSVKTLSELMRPFRNIQFVFLNLPELNFSEDETDDYFREIIHQIFFDELQSIVDITDFLKTQAEPELIALKMIRKIESCRNSITIDNLPAFVKKEVAKIDEVLDYFKNCYQTKSKSTTEKKPAYHIENYLIKSQIEFVKQKAHELLLTSPENWISSNPPAQITTKHFVAFFRALEDRNYLKPKKLSPEIKDSILNQTFGLAQKNFTNCHYSKDPIPELMRKFFIDLPALKQLKQLKKD